MKVIIKHTTTDDWEYRESLDITVLDKNGNLLSGLEFHDGEPEDNSISRNFNDVHSIDTLMQLAWSAGVDGEDLTFEYKDSEDEEE